MPEHRRESRKAAATQPGAATGASEPAFTSRSPDAELRRLRARLAAGAVLNLPVNRIASGYSVPEGW